MLRCDVDGCGPMGEEADGIPCSFHFSIVDSRELLVLAGAGHTITQILSSFLRSSTFFTVYPAL